MSEDTHIQALAAENARLRQLASRRADLLNEALAQATQWRTERDAETARVESLAADLDKARATTKRAIDSYEAMGKAASRYSAELAEAKSVMEQAQGLASRRFEQTARWRRQALAAIAEREVLRHRDRRTQAGRVVVEAAEALVAVWLDDERAGVGSALTAAVQRYWKAQETALSATEIADSPPSCGHERCAPAARRERAAWTRDIANMLRGMTAAPESAGYLAAADWLDPPRRQHDPSVDPESPLPAEQPPVEDTATSGLEAQGGVQQAPAGTWWCCPDCGERLDREQARGHRELGTCPEHADGVLAHEAATCRCGAPDSLHEEGDIRIIPRTPRVWNAGDPEPEGVEKVRDEDGDVWVRTGQVWIYTDESGTRVPSYWDPLTSGCGPLTEVLPEPAAPTAADLQAARDQTRADAAAMLAAGGIIPRGTQFAVEPDPVEHWVPLTAKAHRIASLIDAGLGNVTKPDGEVPEAGRAGEAQTIADDEAAEPDIDTVSADALDIIAQATGGGIRSRDVAPSFEDQDRTEGLDAAIEAAERAAKAYAAEHCPDDYDAIWEDVDRQTLAAAVRAASPLIEATALHAAADDWAAKDWWPAAAELLRDRATRTETS